jgi:hypothetical protein
MGSSSQSRAAAGFWVFRRPELCALQVVASSSQLKVPLRFAWDGIRYLPCDFKMDRDIEVIRSLADLERINDKPIGELWKTVADPFGRKNLERGEVRAQDAEAARRFARGQD